LGENTARKRCAIAKQIFADAVDRELIVRNPFGKLEGLTVGASSGRDYFVTREEADKVIAACPDNQWKLIFALARYGGLRCPSEHLALRWGDIDFEAGRFVVRSSKIEHHDGKGSRVVPMFPELRPYLQAALDELLIDFGDFALPRLKYEPQNPVLSNHCQGGPYALAQAVPESSQHPGDGACGGVSGPRCRRVDGTQHGRRRQALLACNRCRLSARHSAAKSAAVSVGLSGTGSVAAGQSF
jgi:hypothetical protein